MTYEELKDKVEIIQVQAPGNRINSMWYDGQIAILRANDLTFSLEAVGEKAGYLEEDGELFKGSKIVDEFYSKDFKDVDVEELYENSLLQFNNWFEVVVLNSKGEIISEAGLEEVAFDYDEGIELLILHAEDILNDEDFLKELSQD